MANKLNGKVALVTGASRGIGRAIAVALVRSGADDWRRQGVFRVISWRWRWQRSLRLRKPLRG